MPTDYSQLTDRELDVEIAERLGWRQIAGEWYDPNDLRSPDLRMPDTLPRWSTSLDAAWRLVPEGFTLDVGHCASGDKKYTAATLTSKTLLNPAAMVFGKTAPGHTPQAAARAVCEAWIQWHDQLDPGAPRE